MRLRQPLQSGNPMFYLRGVLRSVVQREGMEMSDEGIRGKRKHAILVLGFNGPSAAWDNKVDMRRANDIKVWALERSYGSRIH